MGVGCKLGGFKVYRIRPIRGKDLHTRTIAWGEKGWALCPGVVRIAGNYGIIWGTVRNWHNIMDVRLTILNVEWIWVWFGPGRPVSKLS